MQKHIIFDEDWARSKNMGHDQLTDDLDQFLADRPFIKDPKIENGKLSFRIKKAVGKAGEEGYIPEERGYATITDRYADFTNVPEPEKPETEDED